MKIWLLQPKKSLKDNNSPWYPPFNKIFTFIVRAENEESARDLANRYSGKESGALIRPWLDKNFSDCTELSNDGTEDILAVDIHSY